jgi:hypothetical protein
MDRREINVRNRVCICMLIMVIGRKVHGRQKSFYYFIAKTLHQVYFAIFALI